MTPDPSQHPADEPNAQRRRKTPAAIYGRNSKPPKGWRPAFPGEEPPGSWRLQIARARAVAVANGDEVVQEEHDVVTGGDPNRPAWARILAAVRGNRVQRVYVTKLDRVMRGARHFLGIAEEFEAHGAQLVFLDQPGANVVKGDPSSKAFRGMLAVWAEFELDLTRERSADVMEYGEDGRLYGPRSDRPAGRPTEYGDGHKFRTTPDGSRKHVRARCPLCRDGVSKPGGPVPLGGDA